MPRAWKTLAAVTLLVIVAGCGSSKSSSPTTAPTTSTLPRTNPAPKHFDAVFATKLSGTASVPKGPENASGRAVIKLSTKLREACWNLSVRGVQKLLSSHVRKAPPGKIGPVIIPLGARFATTGCVTLPLKAVKAVIKNPSAYYVDVLARKYLNGALRGQLHGPG